MDDSRIHHNVFNNGYVSFVNGERRDGDHSLQFHHNTLNKGMAHEFSADHMLIANNHFASAADPLPDYWETCGRDGVRGGIAIWPTHADPYFPDIVIRNNLFTTLGNAAIFIEENSSLDRLNVVHNIFDGTFGRWGGHIYVNAASLNNTRISNNIFMSGSVAVGGSGSVASSQITHNVIDGNAGIKMGGFETLQNIFAAPEIKGKGAKPAPYYLPSGPNANIVNAGVDVGLPYMGAAPDIGVYEYGAMVPSAPTHLRLLFD